MQFAKIITYFLFMTSPIALLLYAMFYYMGVIYYLIFFAIFLGFFFKWGDKLILKLCGIRLSFEIKNGELYDRVRSVAFRLNLPYPRIFVCQMPTINVFSIKNIRDEAIMVFHHDFIKIMDKEKFEAVVACELLKIDSGFMLGRIVEAFFISLCLSIFNKVHNVEKGLLRKKHVKNNKIFHKIIFFFNACIYSYVFFMIYSLIALLRINKKLSDIDKKVSKFSYSRDSLATALIYLYKINKKYLDENYVCRLFFINGQGKNFFGFIRLWPNIDERYKNMLGNL